MRPRKQIALLCQTDAELREWRFKLEIAGYAVHGATDLEQTDKQIRENPEVDVLVCFHVDADLVRYVQAEHGKRVLVAGCLSAFQKYTTAECVVPQGDQFTLRLREALMRLVARKRGPMPMVRRMAAKYVADAAGTVAA